MRISSSRPYFNTRLVKYIDRRILELKPKNAQFQIAEEAGVSQRTMLANIKAGVSKLPLDRVPGLAKALECDPTMLFMMAVEQLGGDSTDVAIKKIFGTLVTENEAAWLLEIRKASDYGDPNQTAKAQKNDTGDIREMTRVEPGDGNVASSRHGMNITDNERAWIEFIRLISADTDPAPTLGLPRLYVSAQA